MATQKKVSSTGNQQILDKLDSLGEKVDTLSRSITGDTKEIGLLERVRNLEQWVSNEKKLIYIIVSGIIIDIGARLWDVSLS